MNKKKVKKIIKITAIVILSLALVLALAAVLVYNFVIKPNADKITNAVSVILSDEEIIEEIKPYLTDDEFNKIMENVALPEDIQLPEQTDGQNTEKGNNQDKNDVKDKSKYSNSYEYVKKNIEEDDFKVGAQFASRIDVGYVLQLVSGGLTDTERQELKKYLKERFTSEEIALGIKLYTKYAHLLN